MDGENDRREKLKQERIKSADRKRYCQLAHKRLEGKEKNRGRGAKSHLGECDLGPEFQGSSATKGSVHFARADCVTIQTQRRSRIGASL